MSQRRSLKESGFNHVETWESHSEVTQALIELGFARSIGKLGYFIDAVTLGINTEGALAVAEAAADAAANKLLELLGQKFYVDSVWD